MYKVKLIEEIKVRIIINQKCKKILLLECM